MPTDAPAGTILDQLNSLPERIQTAADRVSELTEQLRIERRTRDHLIVTAVDQARLPQAQVARYAGMSQPHVVRILSHAGDDDG